VKPVGEELKPSMAVSSLYGREAEAFVREECASAFKSLQTEIGAFASTFKLKEENVRDKVLRDYVTKYDPGMDDHVDPPVVAASSLNEDTLLVKLELPRRPFGIREANRLTKLAEAGRRAFVSARCSQWWFHQSMQSLGLAEKTEALCKQEDKKPFDPKSVIDDEWAKLATSGHPDARAYEPSKLGPIVRRMRKCSENYPLLRVSAKSGALTACAIRIPRVSPGVGGVYYVCEGTYTAQLLTADRQLTQLGKRFMEVYRNFHEGQFFVAAIDHVTTETGGPSPLNQEEINNLVAWKKNRAERLKSEAKKGKPEKTPYDIVAYAHWQLILSWNEFHLSGLPGAKGGVAVVRLPSPLSMGSASRMARLPGDPNTRQGPSPLVKENRELKARLERLEKAILGEKEEMSPPETKGKGKKKEKSPRSSPPPKKAEPRPALKDKNRFEELSSTEEEGPGYSSPSAALAADRDLPKKGKNTKSSVNTLIGKMEKPKTSSVVSKAKKTLRKAASLAGLGGRPTDSDSQISKTRIPCPHGLYPDEHNVVFFKYNSGNWDIDEDYFMSQGEHFPPGHSGPTQRHMVHYDETKPYRSDSVKTELDGKEVPPLYPVKGPERGEIDVLVDVNTTMISMYSDCYCERVHRAWADGFDIWCTGDRQQYPSQDNVPGSYHFWYDHSMETDPCPCGMCQGTQSGRKAHADLAKKGKAKSQNPLGKFEKKPAKATVGNDKFDHLPWCNDIVHHRKEFGLVCCPSIECRESHVAPGVPADFGEDAVSTRYSGVSGPSQVPGPTKGESSGSNKSDETVKPPPKVPPKTVGANYVSPPVSEHGSSGQTDDERSTSEQEENQTSSDEEEFSEPDTVLPPDPGSPSVNILLESGNTLAIPLRLQRQDEEPTLVQTENVPESRVTEGQGALGCLVLFKPSSADSAPTCYSFSIDWALAAAYRLGVESVPQPKSGSQEKPEKSLEGTPCPRCNNVIKKVPLAEHLQKCKPPVPKKELVQTTLPGTSKPKTEPPAKQDKGKGKVKEEKSPSETPKPKKVKGGPAESSVSGVTCLHCKEVVPDNEEAILEHMATCTQKVSTGKKQKPPKKDALETENPLKVEGLPKKVRSRDLPEATRTALARFFKLPAGEKPLEKAAWDALTKSERTKYRTDRSIPRWAIQSVGTDPKNLGKILSGNITKETFGNQQNGQKDKTSKAPEAAQAAWVSVRDRFKGTTLLEKPSSAREKSFKGAYNSLVKKYGEQTCFPKPKSSDNSENKGKGGPAKRTTPGLPNEMELMFSMFERMASIFGNAKGA
jgi:hypothetical protein